MWTDLLNRKFLGNPVADFLLAGGILVGGWLAVWIFRWVILKRVERWAARTETRFDDVLILGVRKAVVPILAYGVVYLASRSLSLNEAVAKAITFFGVLLVTVLAIRSFLQIFHLFIFKVWIPRQKDAANLERQVKAMLPILTGVVWSLGALFLLDNLGFKISAIVAGLGIGGVAVALASQAVLGDLFSYFAIMLDRPFELDDFIIVGEYMGTIEHIGIKTTRIRSLGGEQIVFSNKDLTDSRVSNYKRMQLRRVVFKLSLTYGSSVQKLKAAVEHVKTIITRTPNTRLDRAHFASYGPSDLVIEVVYFVMSADYNIYMDTQQAINLEIKEAFEEEGIEFAYPTQTVYLTNGRVQPPVPAETLSKS